ncbi:MAG: FMN-binding protein, partial [Rhodospirillales bacterium]|nr:FMN-binding protein [Rhodospirillales bacterium]
LYGYLGISADTQTVVGLSFYEHGETPGLGALIDDESWRSQWRGKKIWDDAGKPALGAASGAVVPNSPEARYMVDGLTGATWTSRGVTNLLRFWLGNDGFGPYLRNLRGRGG